MFLGSPYPAFTRYRWHSSGEKSSRSAPIWRQVASTVRFAAYFFDIKTALGVDRAIEDPWRVDTVMAKCGQEGHRLPMAIRHLGVEPLPASAPAAQRGHIGLGPSFVDEDEAFGIDPPLIALPARPFAGDVGTLLLARKHGFF